MPQKGAVQALPWQCVDIFPFWETLLIVIYLRTTLQFFNGTMTFMPRVDLSVAIIEVPLQFWSIKWSVNNFLKLFRTTIKKMHRNTMSSSSCLAQEVRLNYQQRWHIAATK